MPDDAVRAVAELAASQHRAFTRRQAAELNFDKGRVATAKRRGWLDEPYPGVLVINGSEDGWRQRLMAAMLAAGGHAVASHRSAARLHHLDGFEEVDVVELSVTRDHRWRGGDDVVAHHVAAIDAADVLAVGGIPCTGLARTLADLGIGCRATRRTPGADFGPTTRRQPAVDPADRRSSPPARPVGRRRAPPPAVDDPVRRSAPRLVVRGAGRHLPRGSGHPTDRVAMSDPRPQRAHRGPHRYRHPVRPSRALKPTVAGSTSVRMRNRSMSSATCSPRHVAGTCSTSGGTRRSVRPTSLR